MLAISFAPEVIAGLFDTFANCGVELDVDIDFFRKGKDSLLWTAM